MNKNFEIFEEKGELPDLKPTDKPADNETVFDSFRLGKRVWLEQIEKLISKTEKRLKKLIGYKDYVKSLFLKDVEDGEQEIVKEREWELLSDDVMENHEASIK
jgi:hypothetical protein